MCCCQLLSTYIRSLHQAEATGILGLTSDKKIVTLCPIEEIEREIEYSEAIIAKIIEAKQKIQAALKETP